MTRTRALLLSVLALVIAGCAAGQHPGATSPVIAFPSDRAGSSTVVQSLDGADTQQRGPGCADVGTSLSLQPDSDSYSFATYRLTPASGAELELLQVAFSAALTSRVWIAVADFQSGLWRFGPAVMDFAQPIQVPIAASDISPNGNLWVAVLVAPGDHAFVAGVSLQTLVYEPPLANLTTASLKVHVDDVVQLDASGSSDPDGIAGYEWDFDNDGAFGESGAEADNSGSALANLTIAATPGDAVTVTVRVEDTTGLQDTAQLVLSILGWRFATIDESDFAGGDLSLVAVNGKPGIAYTDASPQYLKYAYADSADGLGTWASLTIDATGGTGQSCRLAMIEGHPAISYYQALSDHGDLKYAFSTSTDGATGWSTQVAVTGDPGNGSKWFPGYSALADVFGKPTIAFIWTLNSNFAGPVHITDSTSPDGSSGWVHHSTGDAFYQDSVGYISIAENGVVTAVAYDSFWPQNPNWIAAGSDTGGSWQVGEYDSEVGGPYRCGIKLTGIAFNQAMSYMGLDSELKYAYSPDFYNFTLLTIDVTANSGYYNSLALVDGRPAVSAILDSGIDPPAGALNVYRASDATGEQAWTKETVPGITQASTTSITEVEGKVAVAFRDSSSLRYALLYE